MTNDLSAPERRDAPIAMSPERFRHAGHQLVDAIAEFLAGLPDRPASP